MIRAPRVALSLVVLLIVLLAAPWAALADGFIVVTPPRCVPACSEPVLVADQLEVRDQRVAVTIRDGVAETRVSQTFHNPNDWTAEGTYFFPVPANAAVSEFRMWVDGKPVDARLLDADEARATYEDIVRTLRDPALLEFVGNSTLKASIFPVPPGEDRKIELTYGEVVPVENGLAHYRYGLRAAGASDATIGQASISVAIEADQPLRAIYSPGYDIVIDRDGDRRATASWEASDVRPTSDFDLYYSVSAGQIGANVVSGFDPVTGEGYFMLLAAPGVETDAPAVAKDVILVLDTSGSMEGEKIDQAREALDYVLGHLGANDRFAVLEFNSGVNTWKSSLSPAAESPRAIEWVNRLEANGGTDINRALLEAVAIADPARPTMLIFLTDGLPTEGETDTGRILRSIDQNAPANIRLFTFGVGDDVDTVLLDGLASEHHGRGFYVRPGEQLNEAVSSFYASISAPVLTNLAIDWGTAEVDDLTPDPLPDLFAGGQLTVLGTYRAAANTTITLTGEVNGETRSYVFANQSFSGDSGNDWLGRLWATRRIGEMLNQIRLNGENPELVQSVIDLSVRFGIVTPYTSYLLTEDDILTGAGRERAANQAMEAAKAAPAPASGSAAVDQSQAVGAMADARVAAEPTAFVVTNSGETRSSADLLRYAGGHTFLLKDGVWTDTLFDPDAAAPRAVTYLSDDYFALLQDQPHLAAAFALGDHVIVVTPGGAIEIKP